jgi:uncharacterized protein YdeI (BOF family)
VSKISKNIGARAIPQKLGVCQMKKLIVIVTAIAALVIAPLLASSATFAQSRKNTGSDYGYCKSGAKVKSLKECKENGGTQ